MKRKTYKYNLWVAYEKPICVEADTESEAYNMLEKSWEEYWSKKVPDRLGDTENSIPFDSHEFDFVDEFDNDPEKKDEVEVNVLSPDNVYGMLTAVTESYRKLYTEGK